MRGKTLLWIGGALSVLSALPAVAADHDVSITIYANDLALVQERDCLGSNLRRHVLELDALPPAGHRGAVSSTFRG
jgi:hypothetical protein